MAASLKRPVDELQFTRESGRLRLGCNHRLLHVRHSEKTGVPPGSSTYLDQMMDQHLEMTLTALNVMWRPGQLDEPQRQIPVKTLSPRQPSSKDNGNQMSPLHNQTLLQPEIELLVSSGQRRTGPQLSLVSPKVFSPFYHRWSFGSLLLLPLACLVGDTKYPAISST